MTASCVPRLAAVAVAAALLLAGCGTPAPAPTGSAASIDFGLPPCGKPPSPAPDPPPAGAIMPPTARITATREQPPLVQLNGYVQSTPVEVREWIEAREDLQIVVAEDEGIESELLVTDGTWRTFVKARAVCDDASLLAEVIAPEESDAVLPTPAGTPAP